MPCRNRVVLLSFVLAPWCTLAAPSYQLTLLPTLGGSFGAAYDIDNVGRIVGYSTLAGGDSEQGHAVLWQGAGAPIDLLPGSDFDSVATRINDRGQIIGHPNPFYPEGLPGTYLWQQAGAKPAVLATLPDTSGQALAIDNAGRMVGMSQDTSFVQRATTWNPVTPLDGDGTVAYDINDAGTIVGSTQEDGGRAVIWQGGQRQTLGALAQSFGPPQAMSINQAGQVAGTSFTYRGGQFHNDATLWTGSVPTALPAPTGADSGVADLNDSGQVVGWISSRADHTDQAATLWSGSAAIDLNSFLPMSQSDAGWQLIGATAINDQGAIVGLAVNRTLGRTTGFLLAVTAVPEPTTLAMLLFGLAAVGLLAQRRKRLSRAAG